MQEQTSRLELIERAQFATDKADDIRVRLKSLLDAGEITLRDIAKGTSFSPSSISQALNDKYEADPEKINDALVRFYRSWIAKNAIINTSVVEQIHAVMSLGWIRKEIVLIRGPFGRGKTKSVGKYVADHSDYGLFVALTGVTSASELLHAIAAALNIESQMVGTRSDKLHAIIRSLQRNPKQLVIDEADELTSRTLALIKDIHGEGTGRCSIVLIATPRLDKILLRPELGYLRRRITIKKDIEDISFNEARKIADMWPHNLDTEDLKKAWSWSLKHFGVASLVNIMMRGYDVMQIQKKKKIDEDCIEEAYTLLMH